MSRILDCRNQLRRLLTAVPALLLGAGIATMNNSAMANIGGRPPWWPPHKPPVAPEMNAGLVLLPIVIVVMLVSSLQVLRKRAAQKE